MQQLKLAMNNFSTFDQRSQSKINNLSTEVRIEIR